MVESATKGIKDEKQKRTKASKDNKSEKRDNESDRSVRGKVRRLMVEIGAFVVKKGSSGISGKGSADCRSTTAIPVVSGCVRPRPRSQS
jgi:hypothetical protein